MHDSINLQQVIVILFTITAVFGYINVRYLKFPMTVGLMGLSFATAFTLLIVGKFVPGLVSPFQNFVEMIHFKELLLDGMLCPLLFAGALHVKLEHLNKQKWVVGIFATIGVLLSTFIVGPLVYGASLGLGLSLTFLQMPAVRCIDFNQQILSLCWPFLNRKRLPRAWKQNSQASRCLMTVWVLSYFSFSHNC